MMKHLQFKGSIPFMWVSQLLPWGTLSIHYTDVNLDLHEPSGLSAKHLPVLERQCQTWISVPKRHMEAYACLSQDPIPFPHGIIWAIRFGGLSSFHQPPYHSLAHFPDSSFLSFCPFFEPFLAFQLQGLDFKTPSKVSLSVTGSRGEHTAAACGLPPSRPHEIHPTMPPQLLVSRASHDCETLRGLTFLVLRSVFDMVHWCLFLFVESVQLLFHPLQISLIQEPHCLHCRPCFHWRSLY